MISRRQIPALAGAAPFRAASQPESGALSGRRCDARLKNRCYTTASPASKIIISFQGQSSLSP
jgi:hypothetical protein